MSGDRPIFVDDSGRRRMVARAAWVAVLLLAAFLVVPTSLGIVMADTRQVGATSSTPTAAPYAIAASRLALPPVEASGAGCAAITGEVFIDWDLNGWRSLGLGDEAGVAGVDVTAFDANGSVAASTSTDNDGRFRLDLQRPQAVRVELASSSAAFIESPVGVGSGTSIQFPQAPSCTANLGVFWRGSAAGPIDTAARRGVGQVSGRAWIDADCDGIIDPGEQGATTPVQLVAAANRWQLDATTTEAGGFVFSGLEAGVEYEVVVPAMAAASAAMPRTERSLMDGGVVIYRQDELGGRASFVIEEAGASRHGLRFAVPPASGCAGYDGAVDGTDGR